VQPSTADGSRAGIGGGNNALYLKSKFEMTLVDLSPQMLTVSRTLNPECEHREGDMRTVNLGRTFDAVFIHDAIAYMTSAADLGAAIRAARRHCRAGGVALIVPDCVRETFVAETRHGGHDGDGRSLRYLMWTVDPDLTDTTYRTDFAIMLRDHRGDTRVVHDSHIEGVFPRAEWMRLLREAGFAASTLTDEWGREIFVAKRPP
jgi:SAM-dependent methyltransferase